MSGDPCASAGAATNSNRLEIQRIAGMILAAASLQSAEWQTIVSGMERPVEVELPHKLGRNEARRRIANNVHKLRDHIPGGAAQVDSSWAGDQLSLDIVAMGQKVAALIDVEDTKVRCRVMLPGILALFSGPLEAALNRKGSDLLLEDKNKKS